MSELKTRYVIVDEENGVFLGTYSPSQMKMLFTNVPEEDVETTYALFAKDNPFSTYRACSFQSVTEAMWYIYENFGSALELDVKPVECSTPYPDVVELIKSGLGDKTFDMMDGMEPVSESLH
jgi:hypothetical protein